MRQAYLMTALCGLTLHASSAVQAQALQRCVQEGKVSYTDQDCPAGASRSTLQAPGAGVADPGAAQELARQAAKAAQLQKQRELRERHDAREDERSLAAARALRKKCDKLHLTQRWATEDVNRAPTAQREAAQLKARRAAEAVALECPH